MSSPLSLSRLALATLESEVPKLSARSWAGSESNAAQTKPKKLIGSESQQVIQVANSREKVPAEHFDGNAPLVALQVQFHRLRGFREVVHNQDFFFSQLPHVGQNPMVGRFQKFNRPAAENAGRFAQLDDSPHPGKERMLRPRLRLYIDGLISVNGIGNQRRVHACRIGPRKSGVPSAIPLHWCPHPVAVAQINVIP